MPKPTPMFEGEPVKAAQLAISGKSYQADKAQTFRIGDEVVLLVEGIVKGVEHGEQDGLLVRSHKVKVTGAWHLSLLEAAALLDEARRRDARILDEALGRAPLPFDPETGEIPD